MTDCEKAQMHIMDYPECYDLMRKYWTNELALMKPRKMNKNQVIAVYIITKIANLVRNRIELTLEEQEKWEELAEKIIADVMTDDRIPFASK